MKSLKTFILSFAWILLVTSCKKESTTVETNNLVINDTCKIISIEYTFPAVLGGTAYTKCDVTYNGDNISEFKYYSFNGSFSGKDNFYYDAQNNLKRQEYYQQTDARVIESHNYEDSWNPSVGDFLQSIDSNYFNGFFQPTGYSGYVFHGGTTYDYVLRTISNDPNVNFKDVNYTWENGDPVQFTFIEPNSSQLQTNTITYDTSKINTFNQKFPKFWLPGTNINGDLFSTMTTKYMQYFFLSKHLVTRVISTGSSFYQIVGDFTYTYNSQGLITEVKVDGVTILKFSFSCN